MYWMNAAHPEQFDLPAVSTLRVATLNIAVVFITVVRLFRQMHCSDPFLSLGGLESGRLGTATFASMLI